MNYFNYFTEIETRFQQRRGSLLMLSTIDWALIDSWREAGIPLEAVLRGIDDAFDKHDAQRLRAPNRRQRKVNGLAWCAQAVMEATEQAREAAIGTAQPATEPRDTGFDTARIARYLTANATQLDRTAPETAARLRDLAAGLTPETSLEDLDRTLTVLEEKLVATLLAAAPEAQLTDLRTEADRELAPHRARMQAHQLKQIQQQFLQKRLLQTHSLPRLSLFYMPHE